MTAAATPHKTDPCASDQLAHITGGEGAEVVAVAVWQGCRGVCLLLKHGR